MNLEFNPFDIVLGTLLGLQLGLVIASTIAPMPTELQLFRAMAGISMTLLLIARIWQSAARRGKTDA